MNQDWDIKPCSGACRQCNKKFEDRQPYKARLVRREADYEREDYCETCWGGLPPQAGAESFSAWKAVFRPPPPPQEALKKETAETLLRKLMESGDKTKANSIYVLAVMLERKRILVQRDTQKNSDGASIVYEHRKTGEVFVVPDPGFKLNQLAAVQAEVAALLKEPQGAPVPDQAQIAGEEENPTAD